MFLYRDILKKSLAITWRHKYLWFFGLFATLLMGFCRYDTFFARLSIDGNGNLFSGIAVFFLEKGANGKNIFSNFILLFQQDPISASIFLIFFLIVLVLSLFLIWLAIISQAGLINNAAKIIKGNGKDLRSTIKEGMDAGAKNFWPILGYNLIAGALISFFSVLVGLPLIYLTGNFNPQIAFLYSLLFILFIPLALIISFIAKYAACFTIIKNKKFVDSIIEAIKLFEKNWLICLEMALILFIVDIIAIFIIGLIIMALAIPYIFFALALGLVIAPPIFWLAVIAGLMLALFIVILAGSITTSFKLVSWTDLFINLTEKKGGLSKIIRIAENLKK